MTPACARSARTRGRRRMPRRACSRSVASCTSVPSSTPRTVRSGGGNAARTILEPHERDRHERYRPGGVRSRGMALARQLSRPLAARMRHRARRVRRQFREGHRSAAGPVAPLALSGQAGAVSLLIRTDDIGMSHSVNMAMEKLVSTGMPVSVSVLFVCPWYQEAVEILKRHPNVSVGIHLALNSEWKNYR